MGPDVEAVVILIRMGNLLGLLIGHDAGLSVFQVLCNDFWVAMFCFDGISGGGTDAFPGLLSCYAFYC